MSALLRIWPLLLTILMTMRVSTDPSDRLPILGLSCLVVALSLLYYLMTPDSHRSSRLRRGGGLRAR